MKNKKVTIVLIIAVLIVAGVIVSVAAVLKRADDNHKKGLQEWFFKSGDDQYAKEIIDNNEQKYVIDDYTITLKESLYDGTIGYCVFAVTKQDGVPEIELSEFGDLVTGGYGENNRFVIETFANQESRYEIVGDTLYHYLSFRTHEDFEGKIKVQDTKNDKIYNYAVTNFDKYNEYIVNENIKIKVSPLGITVYSSSAINGEIALHYKDGKEEAVLNTEDGTGMGLSNVSTNNGRTRSVYVFKELKKIQDIDYIVFNGEKISKIGKDN